MHTQGVGVHESVLTVRRPSLVICAAYIGKRSTSSIQRRA